MSVFERPSARVRREEMFFQVVETVEKKRLKGLIQRRGIVSKVPVGHKVVGQVFGDVEDAFPILFGEFRFFLDFLVLGLIGFC